MWFSYFLILLTYYSYRGLLKLDKSVGETLCKKALVKIFGEKFKFETVRPNWLKNPETGKNCELDLYCEELNLAVEYNGYQHYIYPNCFHKNKIEFIAQLRRDAFKKKMCTLHNLPLIVVPYNVRKEFIENYIRRKLKKIQLYKK